eukprot:scaffold122434_cov18-Tisochrysis_lutea.AAC.4
MKLQAPDALLERLLQTLITDIKHQALLVTLVIPSTFYFVSSHSGGNARCLGPKYLFVSSIGVVDDFTGSCFSFPPLVLCILAWGGPGCLNMPVPAGNRSQPQSTDSAKSQTVTCTLLLPWAGPPVPKRASCWNLLTAHKQRPC